MQKPAGHVITSPRLTEKGAYLSSLGAYVFNVATDATKREIAQAIRALFKVTPRKVTVARVPSKAVRTRSTNRMGRTAGGKKAYVYLKKGETIELI